jgi:hypothetical protein
LLLQLGVNKEEELPLSPVCPQESWLLALEVRALMPSPAQSKHAEVGRPSKDESTIPGFRFLQP